MGGGSGYTETLTYDDSDNVTERTTSYGTTTKTTPDAWGRSVQETSGESTGVYRTVGAKTERAYDAAGHLVLERHTQTGVGWVETRYEYNARDQVTTVTQTGLASAEPGGSASTEASTTYTYDQYGRQQTVTTPAGVVTTTAYDSAGRVASTQTGVSGTRRQAYDAGGRLVFTSDGHEGVWRGVYDAWGRLYQETQPSGAVIERAYDKAGGLTRETAFAVAGKATKLQETTSHVTSFGAVRQSGQLIAGPGIAPTSLVTTNTYDGTGRLVSVARQGGGSARTEQTIEYEEGTGRTRKTTDAAGNTTEYAYEANSPVSYTHLTLPTKA